MPGGAEEPASLFPDWCDPSPWLWTLICEKYVSEPIWCTVFVVDGVAIWIIAAILLRQREQDREVATSHRSLPKAARVRRLWGSVAATARLATLAAGGRGGATWGDRWARMAASRRDRRQFLSRRDFNITGVITRAAGPLLLLGCSILIWFEVDAYLEIGLPWFRPGPRTGCAGRLFGYAVGLRIALDYARTAFSDPGRPEAEAPKTPRKTNGSGAAGDMEVELGDPAAREVPRCKYCRAAKPPRCHHCKVCRRCVLKMDHHCPFVNNCVGLRNYRFFLFFLVDLVVGCTMVAFSLCPQVPGMLSRGGAPAPTMARRVHVVLAFVVAAVAGGLLIPFLFFHLQLILMNKTSLELLGRRPPRHGKTANGPASAEGGGASRGLLENFSEVCGAPPAACVPLAEGLLNLIVPAGLARMAKRSE